jgi:hypothetical protein
MKARDKCQVLQTPEECGVNKLTPIKELELRAKTTLLLIRLMNTIKIIKASRLVKSQIDPKSNSQSTSSTCFKELEINVFNVENVDSSVLSVFSRPLILIIQVP